MGNRINVFIQKGDTIRGYYSHWGRDHAPSDVRVMISATGKANPKPFETIRDEIFEEYNQDLALGDGPDLLVNFDTKQVHFYYTTYTFDEWMQTEDDWENYREPKNPRTMKVNGGLGATAKKACYQECPNCQMWTEETFNLTEKGTPYVGCTNCYMQLGTLLRANNLEDLQCINLPQGAKVGNHLEQALETHVIDYPCNVWIHQGKAHTFLFTNREPIMKLIENPPPGIQKTTPLTLST